MAPIASGIHDNHKRGLVGEFLKEKIQKDADLSIVSAYFTIYAFEAPREQLLNIGHLNFLLGEPGFIRSLDPDKTVKKFFTILDKHLELAKHLKQKQTAKDYAECVDKSMGCERTVGWKQELNGSPEMVGGKGKKSSEMIRKITLTAWF